MKFTIFISYTSKDKNLVTLLSNRLADLSNILPNSYELKLWDMDIDCSGKWDDVCKNALSNSNAVISLLTENVYETSYVHNEIDLAKKLCDKGELKFIPVFLSNKPVRNDLNAYTIVFCNEGFTDEKLNEIYAKVESYLKEILRLPYTSDTIERVTSQTTGKFFVGRRDKFEEIKSYFDNGQKTVVLTGIGGIGKTELAKNFVLEYGAEYPNSFIVKVNVGETDTTVTRNAKDLVRSIRFENTPTDTDDLDLIFRKNLECLKSLDKKTILIIDGYDVNLDLVKDLWQIFNNLSCEVIFTSRQKSEVMPIVDINELSQEDTLQIFAKYCPAVSQEDALTIADGIDFHTLTIELAARLLGRSKLITPNKLKSSIFDAKGRIPHDRNNKTATIFEHISNIFDLSNLSQFKKDVLTILCRIAPQGLSDDELFLLANVDEETECELSELRDAGLIRYNGKYSLHTIISEVVFRKLAIDTGKEIHIVDFLTDKIQLNFRNNFYDTSERIEYGEYYIEKRFAQFGNIEYATSISELCLQTGTAAKYISLFDLSLDIYNKAIKICIDNNLYLKVALCYRSIAEIYTSQSNLDGALDFYRKAEKAFATCEQYDPADIALLYVGIATVYSIKYDRVTAEEYYKKALKAAEYSQDKNNLGIAQTYIGIGNFVLMQINSKSDVDRALNLFFKALNIQTNKLGDKHPYTYLTYTHIGKCYLLNSQYDKAKQYLKKALEILTFSYGDNSPITATTYSLLASCYQASDETDEALTLYKKSLNAMIASVGENSIDTAGVYINIADVLNSQEKYDEAYVYAKKSVDILINLLGENSPITANAFETIGESLQGKGDTEQALFYLEKHLTINTEMQGDESLATLTSLNDLAATYFKATQYDKALECFTKSLDISNKTGLSSSDTEIIAFYYNIASCHYNLDNYSEAVKYYCLVLDNQIKVYGEEHKETSDTIDTLEDVIMQGYYETENRDEFADCLLEEIANVFGKVSKPYVHFLDYAIDLMFYDEDIEQPVIKYCLENIELTKKLYGEKSYPMVSAYNRTSYAYAALETYEEPLKYLCLALKALIDQTDVNEKEVVNENQTDIIDIIDSLMSNMFDENGENAETVFTNILEFAEKTLGEKSEYLELFFSIAAEIYKNNCYYDEAAELYERSLKILKQTPNCGERLANAYHNLSATYYSLRQYDKALPLAEKAIEIYKKISADGGNTEALIEKIKNERK